MVLLRYCKFRLTDLFILVTLVLLLGHSIHRYHDGTLSIPSAVNIPIRLPYLPIRFSHPRRRSFEKIFADLFRPILHPVAAATFTDAEGTTYENRFSHWTKPLHERILILAVDTRYPRTMFHANESAHWEPFLEDEMLSQAVINHYTYAQTHGYSYKFVVGRPPPGHDPKWVKVHVVAHYLASHDYDFVVYLDADESIRHMHLPFEWLLNRWNVTRRTSIVMAMEPVDEALVPTINAGFFVAQHLPHTKAIMDAWMECTKGELYAGCEKWKWDGTNEQHVFNEYLRNDYNPDRDNIRIIDCGEANGFPYPQWYDPVNCTGTFIRHHTVVKERTKDTTRDVMMQGLMDVLKEGFTRSAKDIVMVEEDTLGRGDEPGHHWR